MPNPTKRALLVGIDKYPRLNQLDGCVNDVKLMRSILQENFGFRAGNVKLLADGEATRDRILAALDALLRETGPDDIVVIHYAGHGSQMTDREGDEPDGMDETIMPFDSEGRWGVNRDITDDEIHLRLLRLGEKTSYTTLIFDSCHSATITRDAFGGKSRSIEPDNRPIAELPPSPIPEAERQALRARGPSGWMPLSNQYVLLAGCRDDETSFEYRPPEGGGSLVHGALTYFLAEQLRQAVPGTSYRDVFERAAAGVNAANSNQHPQMEGRADREVFGVTDVEPMRYVRVVGRSGDTVTLAAGAAHGMTVGSSWSIYPQGTRRPDADEPLGEVAITSVGAVTSEARVSREKTPNSIGKDARAVETIHDYGDLRLKIQLIAKSEQQAELTALRKQLEASPLLQVVAETESAAARVYLLAPRSRAEDGDHVPQLQAIGSPTWAVVGENGDLLMPPSALERSTEVRENLEKLARYRQALALENPDRGSALRDRFSLELLRKTVEGKWIVAEPETAGGQVVFEEGEAVAFQVTSRYNAPVFLNLLDFGLGGGVSLIYPARGAEEKLGAGSSFQYGTRPGEELSLEMPTGFPYAAVAGRPARGEGQETVKLILTITATSLSFLEQEGFRTEKSRGSSPLTLLLETAMGRDAVREVKRPKVPLGQEDWTTVTKTFVLRRLESAALDPAGSPLQFGDASVRTPGLAGRVKSYAGKSGRAEAAELTGRALTEALEQAGVAVGQTIEIDARETGPARGGRGEQVIELQVRDPGPETGQMVMTTDELGVESWHFAPLPGEMSSVRGLRSPGQIRTYMIPGSPTSGPPSGPTSRSLAGSVGRKFLKVLVFPLFEPGIGRITESYANRWEEKHRPYRLRAFGPGDYASAEASDIDAQGWERLESGRALLMVHGTFSRAHTAFGAMPKEFVERLDREYSGRVFALDHFTLSHDPKQNVSWLMGHLPEGISLDLDIICHSRGGLVSRILSEKQGELSMGSRQVRVGRVVFVGAPNAGTILADADHVGDFIDSYTNILNFLPDAGLSDVLAGIITVAKQLAVGAVKGLSGLQSMRPGGEFGKWLNAGGRAGETRYFALASDFTPAEGGLKELAVNRLLDKVFKAGNDLVVPTDGVFSANGSGFFPIEQKLVFQGSDAVAHTGYFGSSGAREKIAEWLVGAPGVSIDH